MAVLDSLIVNVALPVIAADLRASVAASIWTINAYQLTIAALLLPLAAIGDRLGYHRVHMWGVGAFLAGSIACAFADSLAMLVAARVLQGVGAAAIIGMNAALLRVTWPRSRLGEGIGYNTLILSIAAVCGPGVAALVLHLGSWPWLFLVNAPIGLVSLFIGLRALPRDTGDGGGRLLPLDLLRAPAFALSIATSVVAFAAFMLAFVTLPFLLQGPLELGVAMTGLLMTAWPAGVGVAAPLAGRFADRYPAGLLGGVGLAFFALGLWLLSGLDTASGSVDIVWRLVLCGAGFGFFQTPNNRAILMAAPRARAGAAGGMLASARILGQVAGAVGVAACFHWFGVASTPTFLRVAAAVAVLAAIISALRLQVGVPEAARLLQD